MVMIIISEVLSDISKSRLCPAQSVPELRSKGCRNPNKQSEGIKLRTLSPLQRFGQGPSCSPYRLVSQPERLKEESEHGCRGAKYKTYCLLDDPWIILSTSKAFVPEEMKLVESLNLLSL